MSGWRIFLVFLGIDALVLFLESGGISISYREARTFYESDSLLHLLIQGSVALFGQTDLSLRLPTITMHLLSALLFFEISGRYLKRESDRLWLVAIFMLLPGVSSSALLVDNSALVILILLLFVYFWEWRQWAAMALAVPALCIDGAFSPLYLGLFAYGLYRRDRLLIASTPILFALSLYLHGFDAHGTPKGHFLDTLGLYAVIFSPIVFIYLVYTLFRHYVLKHFSLLWFLATVPLLLSLLLSFRQVLEIQVFAPYLILAMPLAARSFFHSYRVRLKIYRQQYRLIFGVSLALLIVNALLVFFNKEVYLFLQPNQKHFAHRQHVAKELAQALKARGIDCVDSDDPRMQLRLRFYGIGECLEHRMREGSCPEGENVTISYSRYVAYRANVTDIPKNTDSYPSEP